MAQGTFPVIVKKTAPTYLKIDIERKGISIIAYTEDGQRGPGVVIHADEIPEVIQALKRARKYWKKKGGEKGMVEINGYRIERRGGPGFVKRYAVFRGEKLIAVYFRYKNAKQACETGDFSGGLRREIY